MRGRQLGSLIGAIGGLVFVMINSGELPELAGWITRAIGAVVFAVAVFLIIKNRDGRSPAERPSPRSMRIYWICVAAEVIAIPIGANVIASVLGRPELVILWVVFVVGAHFLPFVTAFKAPIFGPLAWALIALAVVGTVVSLTAPQLSVAPAATGVLAGFVLLAFSLVGARRPAGEPAAGAMVDSAEAAR